MTVQQRLAEYIRSMGLKQTVICKKIGMSAWCLSAILTDRRKLYADELEQICLAIHKEPNDFMKVYGKQESVEE